jgi:hypothetical protein
VDLYLGDASPDSVVFFVETSAEGERRSDRLGYDLWELETNRKLGSSCASTTGLTLQLSTERLNGRLLELTTSAAIHFRVRSATGAVLVERLFVQPTGRPVRIAWVRGSAG